VIIKKRIVDSHAERGARILIKESDRDASSLEKSSTDIIYLYIKPSFVICFFTKKNVFLCFIRHGQDPKKFAVKMYW
jgi:hypothetical protein